MTFGELHIQPALVAALTKQGITDPMPIQVEALPVLLAGKHAYINSETGTGKDIQTVVNARNRCLDAGRWFVEHWAFKMPASSVPNIHPLPIRVNPCDAEQVASSGSLDSTQVLMNSGLDLVLLLGEEADEQEHRYHQTGQPLEAQL